MLMSTGWIGSPRLISPFDMKETWTPIIGYEGLYEISDKGEVKSAKRKTTSGGILKQVITSSGYYQISMSRNNKRNVFIVSNLLGKHFLPNPDNKPYVCHKNGIKTDNRLDNLYWGTPKENEADKLLHGTRPIGEKVYLSKLNEKQVRAIKHLQYIIPKMKLVEVGRIFKVSYHAIWCIWNNKTWKHITI